MGQAGVCWDNAMAESFWATLTTEYYYRRIFTTRDQVYTGVATWIEDFYNRRRIHTSQGGNPHRIRTTPSGLDKSRINKPSTTCAQPQLAGLVAVRLEGGAAVGADVGGDGAALRHHRVGVPPGHAAGPAAKPLPTPGLVDGFPAVLAHPIGGCASGARADAVASTPRLDRLSPDAGDCCDPPEAGSTFPKRDDLSLHVWLHGLFAVRSPVRPCSWRKPDTARCLHGQQWGCCHALGGCRLVVITHKYGKAPQPTKGWWMRAQCQTGPEVRRACG